MQRILAYPGGYAHASRLVASAGSCCPQLADCVCLDGRFR